MSVDNMTKYEIYKEQFKRLKLALKNGFNLEAIFIEYAIIEDRTESVLRHAGKWDAYLKSLRGRNPSIDSKIKYIKKLSENKKDLSNKYFADDGLLDNILTWKEERNRLIHALLKQDFEHDEIRNLALDGETLLNALKRKVGNYNRAIERRKMTEETE